MCGGLRRLVEALLAETVIPWIRFMYAYPATLDEELFGLMASEERFLSYLDIPLQHANRQVLKGMKRGGDARSYLRLIERAAPSSPRRKFLAAGVFASRGRAGGRV